MFNSYVKDISGYGSGQIYTILDHLHGKFRLELLQTILLYHTLGG
jgi:hypothetical protein